MTPQFTTPCYVRIDDAQQRKEVCEKLTQMGYKNIAIKDDEWILTQCESTDVDWLIEYMKTAIECFDIPTFLDLAAMRSDTYANQLMMCESRYTDPKLDYSIVEPGTIIRFGDFDEYAKAFYHRATAQEIIEWHKQKGEQHETHRNNLNKLKMKDIEIDTREPIHEWFELSRAQYLTVPRSVLQSMPIEWQERFVKCLEELDDTIDWRPSDGCYWVALKDSQGRYIHDDLQDYQRGRRHIEHKSKQPMKEDQCCGNCHLFAYETIDGNGWCEFHQESRMCDEWCSDWSKWQKHKPAEQ